MDLEDQKGKEMENQQERINKFMSLMTEASQATRDHLRGGTGTGACRF